MVIKVLGIALLVVAIRAGVIPMLNNCTAEGLFITTQDGRQIDMKCYWTARAALATAVLLGAVGLLIAMSRRKETRRDLGVLGILLGMVIALLPTELIGVCAMDKTCLNVMKPSLILLGVIAALISAAVVALAGRGSKDDEAAV